jgi:hypothetical protein
MKKIKWKYEYHVIIDGNEIDIDSLDLAIHSDFTTMTDIWTLEVKTK